jgi:hypothetical protein
MPFRIKRESEHVRRLRQELKDARNVLTIAREELARQMTLVDVQVTVVAACLRRLEVALDEHPELVQP